MSRIFDVLAGGGEVALRYEKEIGIIATALWNDDDRKLLEGIGSADVDTALDALELALADPSRRGTLEQRIEAHRTPLANMSRTAKRNYRGRWCGGWAAWCALCGEDHHHNPSPAWLAGYREAARINEEGGGERPTVGQCQVVFEAWFAAALAAEAQVTVA